MSNKKYSINDDFFSNISPLNSYWAGFIAADGNIYKNSLAIYISIKDKEHILRFMDDVKFTGKLREYTIYNKFVMCGVSITSNKIVNDLKTYFNIVPKKSLILTPPELTDRLCISNFIVGYIDGDGSIGHYNNNYQFDCVGTIDMLSWIKNSLPDMPKINRCGNVFRLRCTNKKARNNLVYLKSNAIRFLDRKWNIVDNISNFKDKRLKLDYSDVVNIKKLLQTGMNRYEISSIYDVHVNIISQISTNKYRIKIEEVNDVEISKE